MTKIKIAPAIMDADLTRLGEAIAQIQEAGADQLHVDIMDGHFVPSLVGGTRVVAAIKRCATIPVDVHLMVSNPREAVGWFMDAGADIVYFHHDATSDPSAIIHAVHDAGRLCGLALKPDTAPQSIEPYAAELDCVLAMTVFPGSSGQGFIEDGCKKIPALRRLCRPDVDVYVDGGIGPRTAPLAVSYGANVLAVASAVFSADVPPPQALRRLRDVAMAALAKPGLTPD